MGNAASLPNHSTNALTTTSSSAHASSSSSSTSALSCDPHTSSSKAAHPHHQDHHHFPHPHADARACLAALVRTFGRSFCLAFAIRAGVSLLFRVIKMLFRVKKIVDFSELLRLLGWREMLADATRMGSFIGGFASIYNGMRCLLNRILQQDNAATVICSASIASSTLLFLPADAHRTFALYTFARVCQCWYNQSKQEGRFHFWGSHWKYGDVLLFALGTAQIQYAYVVRPETLPAEYWNYLVKLGPIPMQVLNAVKANVRGLPIDLDEVTQLYNSTAPSGSAPLLPVLQQLSERAYGTGANPAIPPILPCSVIHPRNPQCEGQLIHTFLLLGKRVLPLYLSVTFVPMLIRRFPSLIRHPLPMIANGLWSVTKSTTFFSTFVALSLYLICAYRKVSLYDHRSIYWIAGFLSSWTVLLEPKARRTELALYIFPRGLDSFLQTLALRGLVPFALIGPQAEKLLFALSLGGLMYYREFHPDSVAGFVKKILDFFIPSLNQQTSSQALKK